MVKRLLQIAFGYKKYIFSGLLFSLLFVAMNGASLWTVATLMDTVFKGGEPVVTNPASASINDSLKTLTYKYMVGSDKLNTLKNLTYLLIVIFFLKNVFFYFKGIIFAKMELTLINDLRVKLYAHITRQSMTFFDNRNRGEFISIIMNDVKAFRRAVTAFFTSLLIEPLNIIFIVALLFIISWKFTLYVFIMFPVSAIIFSLVGASIRRKGRRSFAQIARITDFLNQMLDGIRLIKSMDKEEDEISNFSDKNQKYLDLQYRQQILAKISPPLSEMIGVVTGTILFLIGGKMVIAGGGMDSEDFLRYIILLFSVFQPIKKMTTVNVTVQNGLAAAERIFGLLDIPVQKMESDTAVDKTSFDSEIHFDTISFKYEKDSPHKVLDNIDFKIKKGESVALVGSSGSGKSTIADLLIRFYLPQSGTIKIDGKDIQSIKSDSLRKLIGIVSQEVFLLNDTIKNNIAYGFQDASFEQIQSAAKTANALTFINEMEQGWETIVGEKGTKLSGGQKQRISIARAILMNQEILILDEATSALDNESERIVKDSLTSLMKGKTSLIIAHRLSTILDADRIIVLDQGKIIGSGKHDELLESCPAYENLYQQQIFNETDLDVPENN